MGVVLGIEGGQFDRVHGGYSTRSEGGQFDTVTDGNITQHEGEQSPGEVRRNIGNPADLIWILAPRYRIC